MFLRIVLVVGFAVVAILLLAVTKPNTIQITRSAVIKAPPEKIFALLNDFHNWPQWASQD